eukprot:CAMPEP_0198225478 /NCGR_PEP_ID=MMETSP1445-20131203/101280_1 /TAXON_ID=36898 /ORGANISM="Pyramimonas sp., Strain CCMP2087" /LENGTH=189 /DNA_ID=CAMNT_0043905009 /DNA_START=1 /DNA_END=566 /DNA_ORIENTATION=-
MNYSLKQFKTDLKQLLVRCGVEGEKVLYFVEDHQLVNPAFLEIINSLLSGAEVPGLFTNEELDGLCAPLREEMATMGFEHKSLFSFFTSRVKQNLHVALSMDPGNEAFAMRCEANPALYNRCSIQWMDAWSKEGLIQVPEMMLKEVMDTSEEDSDEHLVEQMVELQEMVGGTPRQYVAFVEMYRKIFVA